MATPTYDPIASQTLTSSASSVTFSSIPGTFRDLVLVVETKDTISASNILLRINNDTGSNYSDVRMGGDGTNTTSATGATTFIRGTQFATATTAAGHTSTWQFMDYAQTNKHKTVLVRASNANVGVDAVAGRYASTTALNRVDLINVNFASGSTFSLYGVSA